MATDPTPSPDFAEIGPVVQAAMGNIDIGSAIRIYTQNKGIFDAIWNFIKGLKGKPKPETPPEVITIPVPPPPVPVTPPTAEPSGDPIVSALRSKWYFIERKTGADYGNPKIAGKPIPKPEFNDTVAGGNPVTNRDRLHIDTTPHDENGNAMDPDTPGLEQLGSKNENSTVEHHVIWDGVDVGETGNDNVDVTSEYDDYGQTPVLKLHDIPRGEEHTLSYYARVVTTRGKTLKSNQLPTLRVKPWTD